MCIRGKHTAAVSLLLAIVILRTTKAEVTLISTFSTSRSVPLGPDGIAYHSDLDHLFVVDSTSGTLYELTTDGELVNSFVRGQFPEGIAVLPDGDLLVSAEPGILNVYTTDFQELSATSIDTLSRDPTGVVFHSGTETFFITDDTDLSIKEADVDFNLINTISTLEVDPGFREPEGIDFDPVSGHLLVVDDDQARLYELTTDGEVLDVINLTELTGFLDPEGVAYDAETGTLYIAFDNDGQVALFSFIPTGGDSSVKFERGDCNGDGDVNLSDAVCILTWLFGGAATPGCIAALNTNGDATVDIADPVSLLNFLFAGGPAPVDPFPECGPGTFAAVGCVNPPNCQ